MRRRTRTERTKFAHEMRLVGVSICEGKVRPRERRAHDRLPPGPGETRQPFETLRGHSDVSEEAPMQVARRYAKLRREIGNRERQFGAEQMIDRSNNQVICRRCV